MAGKWIYVWFVLLRTGGMHCRGKCQEGRAVQGEEKGVSDALWGLDVAFSGTLCGGMCLDKVEAVGRGVWCPVHDDSFFLFLPAVSFARGDKRKVDIPFFAENEHRHFWCTVLGHLRISEPAGRMRVVRGIDDGTVCHRAGSDVCHCGSGRMVVGAYEAEIFEMHVLTSGGNRIV